VSGGPFSRTLLQSGRRNRGTAFGAADCEPLSTARGSVMGRNVTLGIGTMIIILIIVALVF
jgi:hypothetical protein